MGQYFQGRLDEVRVYRGALGAGEVAELAGATASSATTNVQWLISDHLSTPRMVVDQAGNLAGIERHYYLPFGNEAGARVGGRQIKAIRRSAAPVRA